MNLHNPPNFLTLVCLLFSAFISPAQGSETTVKELSPFKGSTLLGEHESRFASIPILSEPMDAQKIPAKILMEGRLGSRIFRRPEGVAPLEIIRSYADALSTDGFDLLLSCEKSKNNCKTSYIITSNYHELFKARNYEQLPRNSKLWLTFNAHHYLSAKKKTPSGMVYVVIIASDKESLYSVDTLMVESMQTGSVQITTKIMDDKLSNEGKVVLSGIFFDTGKDTITGESEASLETIATYLSSNSGQSFYVVGHTDDTGNREANVSLSTKRAQAVVNALQEQGVSAAQLSAHGVGPFVPAASNQSDNGKAENRRVELVLRLK
ncbi:MAG: OmpA family protein [Saprospiraceae bacterium]